MALYVGSLFSGAGLGDIAADLAGFTHRWFCECNPYARSVLQVRWPGVPVYEDVRGVHAATVQPVDVVVGGFPCQDISVAGTGAGITGSRSGLWSEYARILRELRPRYAVVENVKALLGRGLDRVLGDLAEIGYNAEWDVFPAAAFGAPHLRERIIIVAYPCRDGGAARQAILTPGRDLAVHREPDGETHWNGLRLDGPRAAAALSAYREPVICRVDDGGPHWLDRLRCLGNGITPPVLIWVFRRIAKILLQNPCDTGVTQKR
jgi:DNA (cytosine-5)-methyltransferase 1